MESNFASLLNRLEGLVTRFENAQGGAPVTIKPAAQSGNSYLYKDFET